MQTALKIYNTMSQKKEVFTPMVEGQVKIYVCGLTVYDYAHLGHARMLMAFDVVVRYLRARGLQVTYVRNITDIDDKILQRARENGEIFSDLTERFIAALQEDERALGIQQPDIEPRATQHIDEIVDMIQALVEKDFAYKADNGDVYFSVPNAKGYGKLSKKRPDELLDGARIEVGELKKDPRDFVLWKAADDDSVGWDSPWGYGRPGWHSECSAMSTCCLGDTFDIHGGGSDLMFPHHENEIAQAEAATGGEFARYWMHNGPLRVDDEKMSKSLGNFFTIRDVLKVYDPEVLRYLLVSSHYRSPINYSEQSLQQAQASLERFYHALKGLDTKGAKTLANSRFEKAFKAAMDDDFNTAEAVSVLFDLVKEIHKVRESDPEQASQLGGLLVRLGGIIGLLQREPEEYLRSGMADDVDPVEVEQLIAARKAAREAKDWAKADDIRDRLSALRVVVEDSVDGSTWRIER